MASTPTVLVTGGAGFIGANLVDRLLSDGNRVVAVDDLSTGRLANLTGAREHAGMFDFHRLDINGGGLDQVAAKARPDVIVHLAAAVDQRKAVHDPVADAMTNVIGTIQVLEAARRNGARKVVFATSGSGVADDDARDQLPVDEGHAGPQLSPHGAAKLAGEAYLATYESLHGVRWTSLALANVYGPRQVPTEGYGVVSTFIDRMLDGRPVKILGDGEQTRDFLFVDDAVHALALAVDRGDGLRCNVGTGEAISIGRLFKALAAATGYAYEPVHVEGREGDLRHSALDSQLAARELGWKPWTTLEEGLAATLRWTVAQRTAE